jgi:outer membrane receptor protein involved in Fe transport
MVALSVFGAELNPARNQVFDIDIASQNAADALNILAAQTGAVMLFPYDLVSGKDAQAVRGRYSLTEALATLLEGSGLAGSFTDKQVIRITVRQDKGINNASTNNASNAKGEQGMSEDRTRKSLLTAAIAILSGTAHSALAQSATPAPQLEEITVTGSRITQTSGFSTPVPVTALTVSELHDMQPGSTLSAQLDILPQFFATKTLQNAGPGGGSSIVGSPTAGLNLRNLGANRTLVLLDGSRVVPTDKQGTVNVDAFPSALLRTVDVVTGGASATYGADAVGGVVNFVLNRRFEGLKASASFGENQGGIGKNKSVEIAAGLSLMDTKLHLIGSLQTQDVDEILADWTRLDNYKFYGFIRNPAWYQGAPAGIPLRLTRPWVTSATASPTGLIISPNAQLNNMQFTPDGTRIVPFVPGEGFCQSGAGCQNSMAGGPEGEVRQQAFSRVAGPSGNGALSRSGLFGAEYEVTDRLAVHWQGIVGRTESLRAENMRFYPVLNAGWTPIIFKENAYLPEAVRQIMLANNLNSFQLRKQGSLAPWHDIASNERSRDVFTSWNYKLGVDYTIPGIEWNVQASYQHGASTRNSQMDNMLRLDRLFLAADAVVDPATGKIVCNVQLYNPTPAQLQAAVAGLESARPLDPYLPAGLPGNIQYLRSPVGLDNTIRDCVPINIFGSGNMSQAALDYIGTWKASRGNVNQDFVEAVLNGELYEGWGAGPLNFALGATWRDQGFIEGPEPADLDIEGPAKNAPELGIRGMPPSVNNGSAALHAQSFIPYIAGDTQVWEVFGELSIPVFNAQTLFGQTQKLDASLAYRASTYDRSGRIDSWKLGLNLQVLDDLRLRLTRSHDVREPTFFELFDAQANVGSVSDPRFGNETYSFSQIQGGNLNLRPEAANTVVAGLVWQPSRMSWLDGLQLSLDYYRVKIDDSVALLGVQPIVDQCQKGVQTLCEQIERDPSSGRITRVFNTYLNVAQSSTKGLDLEVAYRIEPDFVANQTESFTLRWLSGVLMEQSNTPFGGSPIDSAGALGSPDFTSLVTASYGIGPWSVQLQGRHIAAVLRNAQWVEGVDVDKNRVASMTWWNARLGYSGEFKSGAAYSLNFNIQNIFDRAPPIIASFSDFGGGGQSVNPSYDIFGRRYNLSFNYSF